MRTNVQRSTRHEDDPSRLETTRGTQKSKVQGSTSPSVALPQEHGPLSSRSLFCLSTTKNLETSFDR